MIEIQNKRLKDFNDALFNWFLKNYLFNTENRDTKPYNLQILPARCK